MFSGIVQHLGIVAAVQANDFGMKLEIDAAGWDYRPAAGESIAVNGCCLTAVSDSGAERNPGPRSGPAIGPLRFDLIRQTLEATTLGGLRPGDPVNLEHAATPATLLGGHIVQGHVDAVGRVASVLRDQSQHRLRIEPGDNRAMDYIVEKGSIAVDGVSLTIGAAGPDWFEVALIPTTIQQTTLGRLETGGRVNLETDCIAKMVVNWLARQYPGGPTPPAQHRRP